jgi:hypothetical protein
MRRRDLGERDDMKQALVFANGVSSGDWGEYPSSFEFTQ